MRSLELQFATTFSGVDIPALPRLEQKIINSLKHEIIDVRLDIRDFEYAETRAEQKECAKAAVKRMQKIAKDMLLASEYNLFSAIDVAQLGAQIEQIVSDMTKE